MPSVWPSGGRTAPAAPSRPPSRPASPAVSTCSLPSRARAVSCIARSPTPWPSATARYRWITACAVTEHGAAPRARLTNPRSTAKHHPMGDDSLAPSLLLAMPQLRDPNFSRTVVLLCEHSRDGAVGFVVNRPTDIRAANAVALDPRPKRASGLRLWTGGPVETNRGFLLAGTGPGGGPRHPARQGCVL